MHPGNPESVQRAVDTCGQVCSTSAIYCFLQDPRCQISQVAIPTSIVSLIYFQAATHMLFQPQCSESSRQYRAMKSTICTASVSLTFHSIRTRQVLPGMHLIALPVQFDSESMLNSDLQQHCTFHA